MAGRASAVVRSRVIGVDALRGAALCLMFVYHFCFDLRHFHALGADFEHDPFWLGFRALIVTSFMLLVGVSLVLAAEAQATPGRFWKRTAVIAACAIAVSAGSYLMFPATFIWFGILHCIAVTSVLARPLARQPGFALALGAAIVVAGFFGEHPAFDARALSWIGFVTHKPATEDYVPLAPWAGFVLVGIAVGQALVRTKFRALAPLAAAPRWLPFLGRHSLAVYMVHQPVLLGVLWLFLRR
ncbi:MAG: heparan-alpha-glucosaminide N-acetyltransferase [Betaproteobacteria bacterium]